MNKKLLDTILNELHTEAYRWSRQCCSFNNELAWDVLQSAYLKILEGKAKFLERSTLKTWLFSVIRLTALEWVRQERQRAILPMLEVADEDERPDSRSYEEVLQQLPEKQREVLVLVFYHGETLAAVSEILELSIGTVRTHYDRGKKNLRVILQNKQVYEK
jgi:RNA polymerase sigma factor (sigma-70 family)